jgi:hypothetical protein
VATLEQLLATWEARRAEGARLKATVSLELIAADVVDALRELQASDAGELLTLDEASARSGYSADHLARLIRRGTIPNAGRPHAPRIRASDLPRKASPSRRDTRSGIMGDERAQIARSVRDQYRSHGNG